MKIRNKILIYFSTTVVTLTAVSFFMIFLLFAEYREEEFQKQQNEKIQYTLKLITEFKQMSQELAYLMDEQDIHDFYDEKLLVFDNNKELLFSSLDDLPIAHANEILNELSPANRWIETKDGNYDLIGVYVESNGNSYYAVSKAYDAFGYSKLYYLRNVLTGIFISITVIVVLVSLYLSNIISKPITELTDNLNSYDLNSETAEPLEIDQSSHELTHLTGKFNGLLKRVNEAFAFQKNAIHHISHELKTPIAVLVSELEKTGEQLGTSDLKPVLDSQINKAKSLGEIINVLLEIAKIESGQKIKAQAIRVDELIFDIIAELNMVYPDFYFEVNYSPNEFEETSLVISVNKMLLKQAFLNLLTNCITYSNNQKAEIKIDCTQTQQLKISVSNVGPTLSHAEEASLFNRFFRGANSHEKIGFGLGLALTRKIIALYAGTIAYSNPLPRLNVFEVEFPLS